MMYFDGNAGGILVDADLKLRPVIYLSSDMEILGGNGTLSNPYQI